MKYRDVLQQLFDEGLKRGCAPALTSDEIPDYEKLLRQTRIVIYGAGIYGSRIYGIIKSLNPKAECHFTDNEPGKWGEKHVGCEILAPVDVSKRFGKDVLIVIAVNRYYNDVTEKSKINKAINEHGWCNIYQHSAELLSNGIINKDYNKHAKRNFDFFTSLLERREKALQVISLLEDNFSKNTYSEYFRCFLTNANYRAPEIHLPCAYFALDMFECKKDERVVDCGAYAGDTLKTFLLLYEGGFGRYDAFEPHPENFRKLIDYISSLPEERRKKINGYKMGTGRKRETISFQLDEIESSSSHVVAEGNTTIEVCSLDDVVYDYVPTLIKMDIEGSEMETLIGAEKIIRDYRPVLAVSLYHKPEDLIDIPLWIREQYADYRFFVRKYYSIFSLLNELVLFAVPLERLR